MVVVDAATWSGQMLVRTLRWIPVLPQTLVPMLTLLQPVLVLRSMPVLKLGLRWMPLLKLMLMLVWMLMLALSSVDAVMRSVNSNRFFTQQYQLFPDWPIAKTEQIVSLFVLTAALLLMPKVLGAILGLIQQPRAYGGRAALLCSVLLEALFAILIAPLMMVYHTYFIFSIFVGRKVNWNAQAREGRLVPWGEAIKRTWQPTWLALLWG